MVLARARAPGSGGFVVLPGVFADPAEVAIGTGDHVPATETVPVIHTSMRLLRKHGRPSSGVRTSAHGTWSCS